MFWEAGFHVFARGRHIAASDERGAALVVRRLMAAYVRADAKRRCSASWDRESRAVAALRPAGYSSGRGDCARGGCSAGRCGSLGMFYVRITSVFAVLSRRLMFDHACCLPRERQTGRLAICCVPIPPWVVIAIRAFSNVRTIIRLCGFTSGLRVFWRRSRRKREGTRGTEAARRGCAFA